MSECLRLPVKYFEDGDGKFVAFRQRSFKTGAYRDSEAVKIVEMDGVEYMQLPSFPIKVNVKFAEVDGGKADVEQAVFEHRLFFLNEAGEIVTARFNGDVLEEGIQPEVKEEKRVKKNPVKVGVRIKGVYQFEGSTAQETRWFVKTIFAVCESFHVVPKVRVFSDGETTKVRIREAVFKTRSGALKAMQEMRDHIPYGSMGKRQIMKLYE